MPAFDHRPRVPWSDTVIYEAHVRGMTMLCPSVPARDRGTYRGLAHPAVVSHLVALGVTTVELLPVHAFVTEPWLAARGLTNYWGYNPVDYFTAHAAYAATDDPLGEFAEMVEKLHAAGLEVVMDVVYNHTAEGAFGDPCFRPQDVSGCGRTLDSSNPAVQSVVLESLRFWGRETGVDGFRFDLASALARDASGAMHVPGDLLDAVARDPDLGGLKLIAEPWDATAEGYALGAFGPPWAEWNDAFRDDVRDFWRGQGSVDDLATRLAGSSDRFAHRSPQASVNFVTAHDGFTVRDLVSYEHKHNDANLEDNRDGHPDNRSSNGGTEGPADAATEILRQHRARNLISTLMVSLGVPMLRMGDELGHTQGGNNNAYCQDNSLSWMRWEADPGWDLRAHIGELAALRRRQPVLRGDEFLNDEDVAWATADGRRLTDADWNDGAVRGLRVTYGGLSLVADPDAGTFSIEER